MRTTLLLAVLLVGSLAGRVRADEVEPPPRDCVPGSHGDSSRWGGWCEATECTADAECARAGGTCSSAEVALCVRDEHLDAVPGGHLRPGRRAEDRHVALGPCRADGTCERGTCRRARRCLAPGQSPAPPAPPPEPPPSPSSGTCSTSGGGLGPLAGLALALALGALVARSRRR